MADSVTRREARRRKILENSENRLKKITGRDEEEDTDCGYTLVKDRNGDTIIMCNDSFVSVDLLAVKKKMELEKSNQLQHEENYNNHADAPENNNTNTTVTNHDSSTSILSVLNQLQHEENYNNCADAFGSYNPNTTVTNDSSTSILSMLIWNRLYYILVAALVNILVDFKLNTFLGKAITVPYFFALLRRIQTCKKSQEVQANNLLAATLFMCKVRPELTHKFNDMMTILGIILNDLSLYIFSFTLMYFGIRYLHYSDITPSFPNYIRHVET